MNDVNANENLAAAERARERMRRGSRWPRWMYIGYAVAGFVYLTVCGLPVSGTVFNAALVTWILAAVVLTVFAMRQRVVPRGFERYFPRTVAVWFCAWIIVIIVGVIFFKDNLAWWLPGAVVTSGIMLGGGWLDARTERR